jgi:replicative DNA helicase
MIAHLARIVKKASFRRKLGEAGSSLAVAFYADQRSGGFVAEAGLMR